MTLDLDLSHQVGPLAKGGSASSGIISIISLFLGTSSTPYCHIGWEGLSRIRFIGILFNSLSNRSLKLT